MFWDLVVVFTLALVDWLFGEEVRQRHRERLGEWWLCVQYLSLQGITTYHAQLSYEWFAKMFGNRFFSIRFLGMGGGISFYLTFSALFFIGFTKDLTFTMFYITTFAFAIGVSLSWVFLPSSRNFKVALIVLLFLISYLPLVYFLVEQRIPKTGFWFAYLQGALFVCICLMALFFSIEKDFQRLGAVACGWIMFTVITFPIFTTTFEKTYDLLWSPWMGLLQMSLAFGIPNAILGCISLIITIRLLYLIAESTNIFI